MSVLPVGFGSSGIDTGDIPASLRFRRSASAYLSRTSTGTVTAQNTWTLSCFVKRATLGVAQTIFSGETAGNGGQIYFLSTNELGYAGLDEGVGSVFGSVYTNAVFRDPTAALHVVVNFDGDRTAADRIRIFVNGVQHTYTISTAVTATQYLNAASSTQVLGNGQYNAPSDYLDGYLSRICFVDGQALTPADFGEINTTINEWVSLSQSAVKAVVDAGGTNSFMLDFDDATSLTTLGYDKSSKGNNWTLNNFSLTAGTTYDHMLDVPGNSFCTINNIAGSTTGTAADGNLKLTTGTTHCRWFGTMAMSAGSWVLEGTCTTAIGNDIIGIIRTDQSPNGGDLGDSAYGYGYQQTGQKKNNTTTSAYGASYTSGDVIRMEYNATTGSLTFFKNGVSQGAAWSGLTGEYYPAFGDTANASGGTVWNMNFGQAPLHASATYHSAAGGYFRDAPTAGFKALCQRNLEEPAILNPEDHHVDIAVTKSGDTNFTLPWSADTYDTFFEIKRRDAAGDWYQIDGLRGYTKILKSNSTAAETTDANVLGISGTTGTLKSTLADGTYIVSATKAGLSASRQTNTDGSITSTVSRNVDSGFAIVTYTGTGANATVGHGLGASPAMITVWNRSAGASHPMWHKAFVTAGNSDYLLLNTTDQKGYAGGSPNAQNLWNSTVPTSNVFSLGTYGYTNTNTTTYVAYCYADSAIQKSFSYTGNASTDGAYADVGFKMGRALLKCSSTTGNWTVLDSERSTSNVADDVIYENLTNAEATSALADLNSRAIKFRITTDPNSAQTFIGHAWAATTGKYSLSR